MENNIEMEEMHKEIDLIQACINRMAQNSFMIKGWLITLYAVILALLPEKINILLLCIVITTITISFWYLDAFFLKTERIYRNIYSWVLQERNKGNRELMYDLNPKNFEDKINVVESLYEIMISNTLICFYGIPFVSIIIIFIIGIIKTTK